MNGATRIVRRTAASLTLVLLTSACNTYSYKTEVAQFADATRQVVGGFQVLIDENVDTRWVENRQALASARPSINVPDSCGDAGTALLRAAFDPEDRAAAVASERDECALGVLNDATGEVDQTVLQAASRQTATDSLDTGQFPALMAALEDYATTLLAMASAGDRGELEGALSRSQRALERVACSVDEKECNGDIPTYVSMAAEVFRTALVAGLDLYRYRAFRIAIAEADEEIAQAAEIFSQGQTLLLAQRINRRSEALDAAQTELNFRSETDEDWLANLDRLGAARDAYLASLNSVGMFQNIADTHAALRAELENPLGQLDDLRTRIGDFAKQAQAIYDLYP